MSDLKKYLGQEVGALAISDKKGHCLGQPRPPKHSGNGKTIMVGRKRNAEPYVKWKVSVPAALAAQIELHFWDPVLGKPKYGDRSELIVSLLRTWLEQQHPESFVPASSIGSVEGASL